MKIDRHMPQPRRCLPDHCFAGLTCRLRRPATSLVVTAALAAALAALWCVGSFAAGQDTPREGADTVSASPAAHMATAGQKQPAPRQMPTASSPESAVLPDPLGRNQPGKVADSDDLDAPDEAREPSQPDAVSLLRQVIDKIANGPAFDAKIRERVDASGREVVGVGTYEQAGEGSGRFNLQITMHDGDGKHTLQQISDGRLAWTRTEIAEEVTLTRVNLGPLKDLAQNAMVRNMLFPYDKDDMEVSPHLLVGGLTELLDAIGRDYVLRLSGGAIHDKQVWIISGDLRTNKRELILQHAQRSDWPQLCPTRIRLAIACSPDPQTNFGDRLPVLIEFWSDPMPGDGGQSSDDKSGEDDRTQPSPGRRHLISWIELYSIQPIAAPPIGRFEFHHEDPNVNFLDETERYLQRHDVQLTARQTRLQQR